MTVFCSKATFDNVIGLSYMMILKLNTGTSISVKYRWLFLDPEFGTEKNIDIIYILCVCS